MRLTFTIALIAAITAAAAPALACSQEYIPDTYETSLDAMIPCIDVSMTDDGLMDQVNLTYTCTQPEDAVTLVTPGGTITLDLQTPQARLSRGKEADPRLYDPMTKRWAPRMLDLSWTQSGQTGAATLTFIRIQGSSGDGCPDDSAVNMDDDVHACSAAPQRPAAPLAALLPMIIGALFWRRLYRR